MVTGGRGFAARHLVEMLIKYEMFAVRIADLPSSINLEPYEKNGLIGETLRSGRAQYVSADLRHKAQVLKGLQLFQKSHLFPLYLLVIFLFNFCCSFGRG